MAELDCVRGWVEILHWQNSTTDKQTQGESHSNLQHIDEGEYEMVGSPLPLHEYFSLFEIYRQFADTPDPEFGVPRAFKPFDAINVCANEPREPEVGRSIKTLIFVPKDDADIFSYPGCRTQYHPSYPLILMPRKVPFPSLLVPHHGL